MRRHMNVGVLLATLLLLLPVAALAQETTGGISGTVVKANGEVVAGAKVTVTSDRGTREATTDAQGRFLLAFLNPGTYSVTVSAEGYQSIKDDGISVGLGQRIARRYVLSTVMEESMEVTAPEDMPPPVIDMTMQQTGGSIPTELAEQLPLARNISAVVFLAPGVKSGGGTGSANPSISGSSGLENQYVFDGVNVTNAGYGALGAYSIIHGSQGTGINFNFVEETQVLTGGFSSEYGQAMGGIVNVKTKSGTNEWEGNVYGYWQPDDLEAGRKTPDLDSIDIAPTLGFDRLDYGADIGGPIVKDHVFFWMGLNPIRITTTRRAPDVDRGDPNGDPPPDGETDYLLYNEGPLDYETDTLSWAGKLTFQINPRHTIDLSAFGTPTETNNTFTRGSSTLIQDDFSQFSSLEYEDNAYSLKYNGQVTPNFLIEAQVARAQNTFDEKFAPQYDANRLSDLVPLQLGTGPTQITGGIGFFETNETVRDAYQAKFTNIIGKHELRYGFLYEDITYDAATDRTGPGYTNRNGDASKTGVSYQRRIDCSLDPNDPRVTETVVQTCADAVIDGGVATTRPAAVIYRVTRGLLSDPVKNTTSDYTALFIQDDWAITDSFHLDFGVRWEKQMVAGELVEYTFPGEFSPRLGFSWDHSGTGAAKLYGHAGRFYEKLPQDMAVRIFSPEVGVSRDDHFDAALTQPIPQGTGSGTRYIEQTSSVSDVVPGTRNSYTDEFVLGYQHLLGKNDRWMIKGEAQYRTLGRILEDFDVSVDPATCDALTNGTMTIDGWGDIPGILRPGSDQVFTDAFGDPYAVDCGYLLGNVRGADIKGVVTDGEIVDPEREYKALVVELSRQADERWYFMAQYVLSRIEGNYEGLFRNDNGQSDPNLTALYDFANEPAFYETYSSGPLNTDRTHRLQLYGYYNWESGWFVNSRAVLQTGIPELSLASHPIYENGGEVSLTRRGSEGRTPTEWGVDVGFGFRFELPTNYESDLTFSVDIFNLFNHVYGGSYEFDVDNGTDLVYDDYASFVDSVANGIPNSDHYKATSYSAPRAIRFGLKWSF